MTPAEGWRSSPPRFERCREEGAVAAVVAVTVAVVVFVVLLVVVAVVASL